MSFILFNRSPQLARALSCNLPLTLLRNHSSGGWDGRWNPDWRAVPQMPRTMEERIAAAKKYNLHPADYKPFEGEKIEGVLTGFGDYPDLPAISYDARDPYEAWDMPELRRNFGEPLHIDFDMYTGDRTDTRRQRHTLLYMWSCLLGTVGFIAGLFYFTRNLFTFNPMMPKQYPYNDLWVEKGGDPNCMPVRVNYSFDTEGVNHQTTTQYTI